MRALSSSSRSNPTVVKPLAFDIPTGRDEDSPIAFVTSSWRDGISSSSILLSGISMVSSLSCSCNESTLINSSSLYRLFLALSNLDANGFDTDGREPSKAPFLLPLSIIWSINSRVSAGNSNEASSSFLSSVAKSNVDFRGENACGWFGTNANAEERPAARNRQRIFAAQGTQIATQNMPTKHGKSRKSSSSNVKMRVVLAYFGMLGRIFVRAVHFGQTEEP